MSKRNHFCKATVVYLIVAVIVVFEIKGCFQIVTGSKKNQTTYTTVLNQNAVTFVPFGRDAKISYSSWMALLMYGIEEHIQCAGTLIAAQYVLTSAHCIVMSDFALFKVRLGDYDIAEDPDCFGMGRNRSCQSLQEIEIEEGIYHREYDNNTGANDIGLIRLRQKANVPANFSFPKLPRSYYKNTNFQSTILVGWGTFETGLKIRILHMVEVLLSYDIRYCQAVFSWMPITDKQICIKARDRDFTCLGYAGGPLIRIASNFSSQEDITQYGILSYSDSNCASMKPDVFTKVEPYSGWIDENMRP